MPAAHHSPLTIPLLLLVGPTGVGKTAVAVELCDLIGAEVVSADSMQIYRGCDIVTAKPSEEERQRAPHHLIDIREPTQTYSAATWAQDAATAIEEIRARGKQPLIVGGTGFYIRALLEPDTLAAAPPNADLRVQLESELATHDAQWLHDYLATLDPAAAQRLHPNDTRRVIRAIEVAQGSPQFNTTQTASSTPPYAPITFGLDMERTQLYARLEQRIDAMLQAGALDELRELLRQGVPLDSPLMQGLGYRQLLPALDEPTLLDECVSLWKRATRRYAKRQLTWFRHQLPAQWITLQPDSEPIDVARQIAQELPALTSEP